MVKPKTAIAGVAMLTLTIPVIWGGTTVRGVSCILWAAVFVYLVRSSEWEMKDNLMRRAMVLNPGALMVFVGVGVLLSPYPESFGASMLAVGGVVICMLLGFGMVSVSLMRRQRNRSAERQGGPAA